MAEKPDIAKLLDKMIPIVFEAQFDSFANGFLEMRVIYLSDHEAKELEDAAIKGRKASIALIIFDDNS